jgi:hypothetical protein
LFNGDRSGGDVCGGFCDESCERVCDDHPADPVTGTDPGTEMHDECPFYPFYRCDVYDDHLVVLVAFLVLVSFLVVLLALLLALLLNCFLTFYILHKEINFF